MTVQLSPFCLYHTGHAEYFLKSLLPLQLESRSRDIGEGIDSSHGNKDA